MKLPLRSCRSLLGPTLLLAGASSGFAAVSLTLSPQTIDFDSTFTGSNEGVFQATGFAPAPAAGQLDSDAWRATGFSDGNTSFGGTHTTGDFARGLSNGGVSTGGIYSFNVGSASAPDRALGVQPVGDDFTPGSFTLKLRNDTGAAVSSIAVAWDVYIRNDQPRSNLFGFSYSTDDITYLTPVGASVMSPAAADSPASWQKTIFSLTLDGFSIGAGEHVFFRWTGDDDSGSGARDEFALDNITFNAFADSAVNPIPEPSSSLVGLLLAAGLGYRRRPARPGITGS